MLRQTSEFLLDLQRDWRNHKDKVFTEVGKKNPVAYFNGMISLCRVMRWETGETGPLDRPLTAEADQTYNHFAVPGLRDEHPPIAGLSRSHRILSGTRTVMVMAWAGAHHRSRGA